MINYTISVNNPSQHFIQFEFRLEITKQESIQLQLPVWRPGRYELGYFAKNIRSFKVTDEKEQELPFRKLDHSLWEVQCDKAEELVVRYEYYANELNAGSTFLDHSQLYINPVNCFFYVPDQSKLKYDILFKVPEEFSLYGSMRKKGTNRMLAKDYFELFDSPIIVSDTAQKKTYTSGGCKFHVVFQGNCQPDWSKILKDFKQFSDYQIKCFGGFPVKEYWFLVQMANHNIYHGVEHEKSTVLALGPGYDLMTKLYDDFLGVSSHELYHTWNVKNIKPKEFSPYDFSKENYNRIGYIIEGVTTYMGDKMLWKSGVKTENWFKNELSKHIKRHLWNAGRFNHSVRDSSFDTWLDGYKAGIPGRKVSIYTEGALLAFILDTEIQAKTKGKKSLDTVMKAFYKKYGGDAKGYEESDFWEVVKKDTRHSFDQLYKDFHNKAVSYESRIKSALTKRKWKLLLDNSNDLEAQFGLLVDGKNKIVGVHPDSPAYFQGIANGDKILALQGHLVGSQLDNWVQHFHDQQELVFHLDKQGQLMEFTLPRLKGFYCGYLVG